MGKKNKAPKVKVDYQKFLLEKGERVGLALAGGLALILLLVFLLPGMFASNPKNNEKQLKDSSQRLRSRMTDENNVLSDNEKPPAKADDVVFKFDTAQSEKYQFALLSPPEAGSFGGRGQPAILKPTEALAATARIQIQGYVFTAGGQSVLVFRNAEGKASAPMNPDSVRRPRFPGKGGSALPPGGSEGPGTPTDPNKQLAVETPDSDSFPKELSKITSADRLVESPLPLRVVYLTASFPFKQQLEEFQVKLRKKSLHEVLTEPSAEPVPNRPGVIVPPPGESGSDRQFLEAFRFLPFKVERAELDANGKMVGKWEEISDLQKNYRRLLFFTGQRDEPDDPRYNPLLHRGMAMPRLRLFREGATGEPGMNEGPIPRPKGSGSGEPGGTDRPMLSRADTQYPDLEKRLPRIQETLKKLEGKKASQVSRPPNRFQTDDIDIFAPAPMQPGDMEEGRGGLPREPGGEPGKEGTEIVVPDYCLLRLVDVTIQPGKTYRYRLKVRMANPNYNRAGLVANPDWAREKELESDWWEVPGSVTVEPELYFYAVDQQQQDRNKGIKDAPARDNRAVDPKQAMTFQIHRWLDVLSIKRAGDETRVPVGDWVVAERVIVHRGEYVGRHFKVQVPYYRYSQERFVMASDASSKAKLKAKDKRTVDVYFGAPQIDGEDRFPLIDFDSNEQSYDRVIKGEDKDTVDTIRDQYAGWAVTLSPEGKLLLHETAAELSNTERTERIQRVRQRIQDVEAGRRTSGKAGGLDG